MKAITLLSGGLDSSTLLAQVIYEVGAENVHALSFDYGQRHRKELEKAKALATKLGIAKHHVIKLAVMPDEQSTDWRPLAAVLSGSSLTDESVAVPDGHYAEEQMKITVVPNRNAIMLSIAYGVAVAEGADWVGFAAHSGDHTIYPDCRPDFVEALDRALATGNKWAVPIPTIYAPFLSASKGDIAVRAVELKLPIEDTWSCYKGGDIHCGTCGTCYERREALGEAEQRLPGFVDPTSYVDNTTTFETPAPFEEK